MARDPLIGIEVVKTIQTFQDLRREATRKAVQQVSQDEYAAFDEGIDWDALELNIFTGHASEEVTLSTQTVQELEKEYAQVSLAL